MFQVHQLNSDLLVSPAAQRPAAGKQTLLMFPPHSRLDISVGVPAEINTRV